MRDSHTKSQLNVRISDRLHARINVMKGIHGFTVSEVFEKAITEYMDSLPVDPGEPLTISHTNLCGKWIEFWFHEMPGSYYEAAPYHKTTKAYRFWNAIDEAGLTDHVRNFGLISIQTFWDSKGEIVKVKTR